MELVTRSSEFESDNIWWDKPLGVQKPVQIYLEMETEQVERVSPGLTIASCEDSIR